jgi:hypothetical protein
MQNFKHFTPLSFKEANKNNLFKVESLTTCLIKADVFDGLKVFFLDLKFDESIRKKFKTFCFSLTFKSNIQR